MDTEKDDTIDTIKDIATITYTKVYKEASIAFRLDFRFHCVHYLGTD